MSEENFFDGWENYTAKIGHQDCWDSHDTGVRLKEQYKKYSKEELRDYCSLPFKETLSESVNRKNWEIGSLDSILKIIEEYRSIATLLEYTIILNVNEFKLRDNPTPDEVEDVLEDFEIWVLRGGGDEEIRNRVEKIKSISREIIAA